MSMISLHRYCLCGGAITIASNSVETVTRLDGMFTATHNEVGCGPATPRQAGKARRKAEDLALREVPTDV